MRAPSPALTQSQIDLFAEQLNLHRELVLSRENSLELLRDTRRGSAVRPGRPSSPPPFSRNLAVSRHPDLSG